MKWPWPPSENVPLAPRTTLEVGGPARYHAVARDPAELAAWLTAARARGARVLLLGGGSNLLVADAGFDGLALEYAPDRVEVQGERLRCQAGAVWDRVVERAVQEDLAGLECLSGIPGRAGAAPIQNIGAYGQEVAETLAAVEVVDCATGERSWLPAQECGFSYRWSRFKGEWAGRFVVMGVEFRLRPGGAASVRYADLKRRFGEGAAPGLAEVRRTVIEIRRSKSMVYDPDDPNHRSAGSFFMNPVVEAELADRVAALVEGEVPRYPAPGGKVKLSAAWLIEKAGFSRGLVRGRVGLSSNHTLALINRGGATAAEIVELTREIRAGVQGAFGVELWPEPVWVGFEAAPFLGAEHPK